MCAKINRTKPGVRPECMDSVCCFSFLSSRLLLFKHTFMSLARLSRELMSSPSLQACKQEITFWVSMRPGRIVRPDRLPRKYCVNLGVATSPPGGGKERREEGRRGLVKEEQMGEDERRKKGRKRRQVNTG